MKIKKVTNYKVPSYPTLTEMTETPELMDSVPNRWQSPKKLMMIIGISSLLTRYLEAESSQGVKVETVATPENGKRDNKQQTSETVEQRKVSFVDILPEALAKDGRGTFGCVAMNPPTFLSESEALELIHNELLKAGLKLKEDLTIENVEYPNAPNQFTRRKNEPKRVVGKYTFDYASEDESILIEFFSRQDYKKFTPSGIWSSATTYDFPKIIEKFTESPFKTDNEKETRVGLFFDPLVSEGSGWSSYHKTRGLEDQELANFVQEQFDKQQQRQTAQETAKAKLKEQVDYFITQLREAGKLPKISEKK